MEAAEIEKEDIKEHRGTSDLIEMVAVVVIKEEGIMGAEVEASKREIMEVVAEAAGKMTPIAGAGLYRSPAGKIMNNLQKIGKTLAGILSQQKIKKEQLKNQMKVKKTGAHHYQPKEMAVRMKEKYYLMIKK